MVLCLSQRCLGRAFKLRINQGSILYSASLVNCFHLIQHKTNTRVNSNCSYPRSISYDHSDRVSQTSFLNPYKATCFFQNVCKKPKVKVNLNKSKVFPCFKHMHSNSENENKNTEKEKREKTIFTIPNILSFSRIVACPVLGYNVLYENYLASLLLFIAAGITDMLDGFIARRYPSQMSYLGSVLDPVADKLLVGVLTVTLTLVHLIPVPLAVIILGRDVGLILSSFVVRFISLPRPKTFSRFFDLQLPTVQVTPTLIGKINTFLQLALISLSLTAPVLHFTDHIGLVALQYVVGLTTLVSGVDYMITGRGFKYFNKNKANTDS